MLDDVRNPIKQNKRLSLGGGEKEPSRAFENPSTILLVGECSRHSQRAGHPREQGNCFPPSFLLVLGGDVLGHPADVGFQRLLEWSAGGTRSSRYFGGERRHRTAAGDIVAVPNIEVGVDECLQLTAWSRALDRPNDAIADFFETVLECLRKQPFFAVKVTVEPPVRQTEIAHEIGDTGPFSAARSKPASRGTDDALARLLLVIRGVTHR